MSVLSEEMGISVSAMTQIAEGRRLIGDAVELGAGEFVLDPITPSSFRRSRDPARHRDRTPRHNHWRLQGIGQPKLDGH